MAHGHLRLSADAPARSTWHDDGGGDWWIFFTMRNTTGTSPGSSRLPAGLCRVHEHADGRILRRSRSAALTGGCRLGFFASPRQLATSALGLLVPHELNFQWDRGRKRSCHGLTCPMGYTYRKPCTFARKTTQLSFRGKQALVVGALEAPPAFTCGIVHLLVPKLHFSLPLRRLLEESTGLLEEEGGSQGCSARKLDKVRQSVVADWPP